MGQPWVNERKPITQCLTHGSWNAKNCTRSTESWEPSSRTQWGRGKQHCTLEQDFPKTWHIPSVILHRPEAPQRQSETERQNRGTNHGRQGQAFSTRSIEAGVYHTTQGPRCRLCKDSPETIQNITGGRAFMDFLAWREQSKPASNFLLVCTNLA